MSRARGMTVIELLTVCALLTILAAMTILPNYRHYVRSRAAKDAAIRLAADIGLLERSAQNGGDDGAATLEIEAARPLSYAGFRGRPPLLNASPQAGSVLMRRTFPGAVLAAGPIDAATPLLFARNGSAQYRKNGVWTDQHQTIRIAVSPADDPAPAALVMIDLFSGAVWTE